MAFIVLHRPVGGVADLLAECTAWVQLPPAPTKATSRLPTLVREVRRLTGWSQRDLADILGTSHTTVRKLETDGRVTARSRETAARVAPLHGVLSRLARAAACRAIRLPSRQRPRLRLAAGLPD
ncbi:helix-turn-helix transcriptional regulator [Frankia sp. Cppng1_Ct_nod]|uniref:helix-turn-helix domain-containing protein n=1 Tax=Frankia sp. Cppng1_Ct_nod TaxID=2897162 RepID=UPI0013EF7A5C|nr:helix-turn-helix transcriptional regulator [Frankia sp. Cppng1_Ct_nod]